MMGCFVAVINAHRSRVTRTEKPKGVTTSNNRSGSGFTLGSYPPFWFAVDRPEIVGRQTGDPTPVTR